MLELPGPDFGELEIFSVRETIAAPKAGVTSGSSSCCSAGSCG
ncbi:thiazolylpeptide-type bacteriocin [Curtobacterium sp. SL109]